MKIEQKLGVFLFPLLLFFKVIIKDSGTVDPKSIWQKFCFVFNLIGRLGKKDDTYMQAISK